MAGEGIKMFEKILVPLDGSELGELVLPYVEEMGRRLNSEIVLLHFCPPDLERFCHEHQVYLQHIAQIVKRRTKGTVKTVALSGRANRIIVDYAVNQDIGLIVGMSRSESDTNRWAIGSTADKVVRETSKPVLIISADVPTIKRGSNILNKVLISLDGSHASEAILPYVKNFMCGISKNAETEVTLLRVLSPSHHVPVGEAVVIVPYTDVELSQLKEQAESYLVGIGRELEQDGIIVHCDAVIRSVSTADQILDFATKKKVNLIAMSTHGRTGISRLFLGTTTDRVLHSVKIPILLIKPTED